MQPVSPPVRIRFTPCVAAAALGLTLAGHALAEEAADKSGYHLFNPTPRELMRDISPDRPDATESPITVDAGHAQLELSFVDYTYNDDDEERTNAWTVLDTNIRLGLTNNVEAQFIFGAYSEEHVHVSDASDESEHGFGDVTVRVKVNLWGNDAGDTAFALMPYVTIPTGTDLSTDHVEGGVVATLGWDVAENWGVGGQLEAAAVYDDDDGDYDAEFAHTAVIGFDIAGPLGAYVEYLGVISTDGGTDYQAYASTGLTWQVNADLIFDVGTLIGLTDDADDFNVFTGMTIRF